MVLFAVNEPHPKAFHVCTYPHLSTPLDARAALCYALSMTDIQQSDSFPRGDQPGKTRTLWHPLLARMLDFALASAFKVEEEVSVGKMPLRVDILLVRRESGQLPEAKRQELSALVPLLNRFTLIEFKGPTDSMNRGDFAQLLGCAFLWHSQQTEMVPHEEVSLIVLAPTVSGPLREELMLLGCEASQHESGIFRVLGLPFPAWLVETDLMAERDQPILSLVSRVFLKDRERIIEKLAYTGHEALLRYMVQQIKQFGSREGLAMQQGVSDGVQEMRELGEELLDKILEGLPAERRLRGLPLEDVLRALPPEKRLRGLSPEELVAGLTEEQASQLRELLEQRRER